MNPFINKQCQAYPSGSATLNPTQIDENLVHAPQWYYCKKKVALCRDFKFEDFDQLMLFLNQVADIARAQDHHPNVEFSYQRCTICFNTHTVNGVTENEFICASLIDALLEN